MDGKGVLIFAARALSFWKDRNLHAWHFYASKHKKPSTFNFVLQKKTMAFEYAWWEYFLIPWIAGIVGYGTNVLALQLTFYPLEFWGIELFRLENEPWGIIGWQGIIPTKAKKMASITFDLMTRRLLKIHEVFARLQPDKFAEAMDDAVLLMMDQVINEVAEEGKYTYIFDKSMGTLLYAEESENIISQVKKKLGL